MSRWGVGFLRDKADLLHAWHHVVVQQLHAMARLQGDRKTSTSLVICRMDDCNFGDTQKYYNRMFYLDREKSVSVS